MLRTLIDGTPGFGDQPVIAEVMVEIAIPRAQGAGAAGPGQRQDVRIVGAAEFAGEYPLFFAPYGLVRHPDGAAGLG